MAAGRPPPSTPDGAHFLTTGRARGLVADAAVAPGELVFDLGAGTGVIAGELLRAGARVVAIERDPRLVVRLRRRYGTVMTIVEADLHVVPLPRRPYRVVANPPFGMTSRLLGRLLDPGVLTAADLVVAAGVARAITARRPASPRTLRWAGRYRLSHGRRLAAECFRPPPSVDAAVLVARRLVVPTWIGVYDRLIDTAYAHPRLPWESVVRGLVTGRQARRVAAIRELPHRAPVAYLSATDWAAVAELIG